MQPLEELLDRIKWDVEFGKGAFALGYYDRVAHEEHVVRFESVTMDPQRPGTFVVQDETGSIVHIPLHRVRTVFKNGVVIWQRPVRRE
jgi:uncharacterized protein (UPF0248 family)